MQCTVFFSETFPKRLKFDHDDTESINRNSLMAMEDHVLDRIMEFLDFADLKSLSETCHRFNNLFGSPRHQKNLWLNLSFIQPLTVETLMKSTRRYTNLMWEQKVEKAIIEYLSPSLMRLKMKFTSEFPQNLKEFLVEILPHFANLTHLEFRIPGETSIKKFNFIRKNKILSRLHRIEMNRLEHLTINDGSLCGLLMRYCIDFTTERLHTICVGEFRELHSYSSRKYTRRECKFALSHFYGRLRDLITRQRNLKVLELQRKCEDLFNVPLVLESKLKELDMTDLYLYSRKSKATKTIQFDNLFNFLVNQTELKISEAGFFYHPKENEYRDFQFKWLQKKRFDLPVDEISIAYSIDKFSDFSYGDYSLRADESMLRDGKPNLTVRKLCLMTINESDDIKDFQEISSFISLIGVKFPNIVKFELTQGSFFSKDIRITLDLTPLNNFINLKEFCVDLFYFDELNFKVLEPIKIKNLKRMNFSSSIDMLDGNLIGFIERHSTIEEITTYFENDRTEEEFRLFIKVIERVMKTLHKLKLFYVLMSKNGGFLSTSIIKEIIDLISQHTHAGFQFRVNNDLYILKRADSKLVRKIKGRWELIA